MREAQRDTQRVPGRRGAVPILEGVTGGQPLGALWTQFWLLLRMQLARVRLAWRRYFIVSSAMPLGITILLRVRGPAPRSQALQFVAGAVVLAVALSALTFLAQRVAWMKANRAFDYYNTLPTSNAVLLLAIFISYFAFAVPGMVAIALLGGIVYGLPLTLGVAVLWALPTLLLGGIALAGLGALIGLAGRDEQLAGTYANLAMMAILFLAIIPSDDFPRAVQALLGLVPSTYMVDSLKDALVGAWHPAALS
ncbi:MAG: ABC transporter permease, partial [Chloroflexi bacterium]|nr:ABC transporter permease [Chloroflexota bacterium]